MKTAPILRDAGCVLVVGLALGLVLLTVSPTVNPPKWDEFIVAYDAHRVVSGQVPYRDFFNFIPPGILLALAAVFRVAGSSSLTVARYASLALTLTLSLLAWSALRRRGWSGSWACIIAVFFPICIYPFWAVASHQWLADLFLIGVFAVMAGSDGAWRWFLAGLFAGLALLSLQPQGLLALVGCGLFVLLEGGGRTVRRGALTLGGVLAVWVPFGGYSLLGGTLGAFFRDTWVWPAENYSRSGNENAGPVLQDWGSRMGDIASRIASGTLPGGWFTAVMGWALYGLLAAAGAALLVWALADLVQVLRKRRLPGVWPTAALTLTVLQFGLMLRGNLNWLHLMFALFPLLVLRGCAMGPRWGACAPWTKRAMGGALLLCLTAGAAYHARPLWRYRPAPWEFVDADRPIRESEINRFLRAPGVLHPGDTLAAFPEGGEVYLYTAPAAVGYTYLLPLSERYNTPEDHRVVAGQIEARRPRFVMVTSDMEAEYLDEGSPVGRLLRSQFHRVRVVGPAVLYERPLPSPPG